MPVWQPEAATRSTEKAMTPQGHAGDQHPPHKDHGQQSQMHVQGCDCAAGVCRVSPPY